MIDLPSHRNFPRLAAAMLAGCAMLPGVTASAQTAGAAQASKDPGLQLMGNRFFTFNTVVRVRQIETSRDVAHGPDESSIHTPKEARAFRAAVEKGWPGARITWAFSWLALKDQRPDYRELKELVVSYHEKYGDEITFVPGGFFANMYNTREQVNRDLHDGLQMVSEMVGDGYRPRSVIAGFLSAENLRFLAEEEGIHVCQGNIWSQYAVDNGDGDGSICYPYYPSREHFCKPAQGKDDLIDCVNLDGWTVDFLCARIAGSKVINGVRCRSRQGVGPIETVIGLGTEQGTGSMLATTAAHFDEGFALNGFAWINCIWELGLVEARKIYNYKGRNGLDGLVIWLSEMRRRWPEAKCITQGEFGLLWREQFRNNDELNYRFVQRGSGIGGSDPDLEIRWFMNKDFRLALLRDWKAGTPEELIDFTRYDLKAREPADPKPGQHTRNWSLINRLNQKGLRPQDKPIPIGQLTADEQAIIKRRYPDLIPEPGKRGPDKPNIYNCGMKGKKGTLHEGGARVPLFLRFPGAIKAGVDVDRLARHYDLFPTLAEFAGAKLPPSLDLDGRSLKPLIDDPQADWKDRYTFFHKGRWGKKNAPQRFAGGITDPDQAKDRDFAVRCEKWRLVGKSELYDIDRDPGERNNVAAENPEVVRKMLKAYDAWWDEVRPMMVNEDASLDTGKPFIERFEKQKKEQGIPRWKPGVTN